ncbi:hypothetical protein D9M71_803720 [compost metagenome]
MARTILHERDQVGVAGNASRMLWRQFFEQRADTLDHVDVLLLVVTADVISVADLAFSRDFDKCAGMVLDEQPVTYL